MVQRPDGDFHTLTVADPGSLAHVHEGAVALVQVELVVLARRVGHRQAGELVAVVSIDGRPIGDGEGGGPLTARLRELFAALTLAEGDVVVDG